VTIIVDDGEGNLRVPSIELRVTFLCLEDSGCFRKDGRLPELLSESRQR